MNTLINQPQTSNPFVPYLGEGSSGMLSVLCVTVGRPHTGSWVKDCSLFRTMIHGSLEESSMTLCSSGGTLATLDGMGLIYYISLQFIEGPSSRIQ